MQLNECINFTLRSRDITSSTTYTDFPLSNSIGSADSTRTKQTFFNINIKNMLGDLYDKYDVFNLRLNSIIQSGSSSVASGNNLLNIIRIEGLPFTNGLPYCDIGTIITLASGLPNLVEFGSGAIASFYKCENVNIRISLLTVNGQTPTPDANSIFPRMEFYFNIIPVDNENVTALDMEFCGQLTINSTEASINADNNTFQFNNIDLMTLLGDRFERGAKYNLVYSAFSNDTSSGGVTSSLRAGAFRFSSHCMDFNYYCYENGVFVKQPYIEFPYYMTSATRAVNYPNSQFVNTFTINQHIGTIYKTQIASSSTGTIMTGTMNPQMLMFDIWKLKK